MCDGRSAQAQLDGHHSRRTFRTKVAATAALALLALFGAVPSLTAPTPASAASVIQLQQIASGLSSPVAIAHTSDSRLFIVELSGTIRIFDAAQIQPTPFLDVSGLISYTPGQERGLLGLAFHPSYPSTPYFYVDYTNSVGNIVIARYRVSIGDPNVADPSSALILLTIPHSTNTNHNGGQLAFGPDGKLYVGVGDGGGGGDGPNNAQNLGVLLGKILRLDVDIAAPYVPATNPFVSTPGARGEIWAYGLRNPWRFSFDRSTGDLLIGDVGEGSWEEIDVQLTGSAGGQNYGWRLMEGNHCYNPSTNCDPGGLTPDSLEYDHSAGDCAVIGGARYRGSIASLTGSYLYGDFCSGRIWSAAQGPGNVWTSSPLLTTAAYSLSSFGEDQNGDVYVAGLSGGRIYKVVAASVGGVSTSPDVGTLPRATPSSTSGLDGYAIRAVAGMLAAAVVAASWAWRRRAGHAG